MRWMPTTHPVAPPQPAANAVRRRWSALQGAVAAWMAVALAGQLAFAAYVMGLYGGGAVAGQMDRWNLVTPRGWVPGQTLGNLVFGTHVLFTVVIVLGGLVQTLPPLRRHAPVLHRWNGRLYLLAAVVLALGGLAMLLTRGTVGGLWQQVATAVNGGVILLCAAQTWRHARARRQAAHRRWALRLFLSVSGVWFFRIGLMAWLLIFQAPVGFDPHTFSGPFLTALAFAQFMLPLLVLELVMHAQALALAPPHTARGRTTPASRRALWTALWPTLVQALTLVLVLVLTVLTALGIVGATLGMWLPRL